MAAARRTPSLGLTGSLAAGKSEALAALGRLGAATLSSDALVHELLGEPEVAARLSERWGEDVISDGRIDRARVGSIVFNDPDELAWLEGTLHPLVRARTAGWRARLPGGARAAVVEVPLLFETNAGDDFDATICVTADDATRARRAGARGTDELAGRELRQLTQAEKAARADYVVANDGSIEDLERRLEEVLREIEAREERA